MYDQVIRDKFEHSGISDEYPVRLMGVSDLTDYSAIYLTLENYNDGKLMYGMDWDANESDMILDTIAEGELSAHDVVDLGKLMMELWDRLDKLYNLGEYR